jgi:hypothetical protein
MIVPFCGGGGGSRRQPPQERFCPEACFYFAASAGMAARMGLEVGRDQKVTLSVGLLEPPLPRWCDYFTIKHSSRDAVMAALRGNSEEARSSMEGETRWFVLQFCVTLEEMGRLLQRDCIARSWDYSGFQISDSMNVTADVVIETQARMTTDAYLQNINWKVGRPGACRPRFLERSLRLAMVGSCLGVRLAG